MLKDPIQSYPRGRRNSTTSYRENLVYILSFSVPSLSIGVINSFVYFFPFQII